MILQLSGRVLDLSAPLVMGILNLTPDSFSDGGCHASPEAAVARARSMVAEGAAIVDVGGESTRPGATPVGEQEELDRTIPVIERLRRELDCVISIDTMKPSVMRAACAAGAAIVNDVNALRAEGAIEAVQAHAAAAILMHMQGRPASMQDNPHYENVVAEVGGFLHDRVACCVAGGIARERLLVDPGFGFGKSRQHNLQLLANLHALAALELPMVIGVSRKGMLAEPGDAPIDRLSAGLAAAVLALWQGARIIRTHDVRATVAATQFSARVLGARS